MAMGDDSRIRTTVRMRWIARVWSLPIIVYALLLFGGYAWNWATTGIADPYAVDDYPAIETLPPIMMFLSIVGLGIAWRWERLGGTIAIVFQLATLIMLFITRPITRDFPRMVPPYLLSVIVVVPAVLFLVCWQRSDK